MIVVNYLASGALFCLGLYTCLTRRNLIKMVMGLSVMEASTYLLVLSIAHREGSTAPILLSPPAHQSPEALARGNVADPVLQNFCLTAVIIGVAVPAVFLSVSIRVAQHYTTLDSEKMR
ncbi:MAG: sodium:proton antiporter, partial [Oryzihumus sp.]